MTDFGPVDSAAFKRGMRRLAGSVSLITARSLGARVGLTATAICSVCADPPTLLCCVNRSSASYLRIVEAGAFAVNVLAHEDQFLADRFASRLTGEEKFAEGAWFDGVSPLLQTAAASFDCRIASHVEVGTHGILFGEIRGLAVGGDHLSPLLYADGGYGVFAGLETLRPAGEP